MWTHQPLRDWIDAVCRQYSRITGHALQFEASSDGDSYGGRGRAVEACEQWRATLSDGTQTVGVLRLSLPAGHTRDADYLRACETAEMTAQLIERVLTVQAGEHSIADQLPPQTAVQGSRGRLNELPADSEATTHPHTAQSIERLLDVLLRVTDFPVAALIIVGADGTRTPLSTIRTSGVLTVSSEELHRCHEHWIGEVAADRTPQVVRRCDDPDQHLPALPSGFATGIAQRVGKGEDVDGSLWLFDRRVRRLTARDQQMIESVSARLERLLEQVTLLDHSSHSRQVRAELKIASQSQPSSEIQFRGTEGWFELAGRTQSEQEIGGDLLEVIPLADEWLFLAIGDAAGHSIPAAIVMANVRGAIRALFDSSRDAGGRQRALRPQQILTRVNAVLYDIAHAHQFMTLCCGILDRRELTFEYANAGHPPPLLLRDEEVMPLEAHGLVLGVVAEEAYEPATISLQPGDVLLLYTDGVPEAVSRNNSLFGLRDLMPTNRRLREATAAELRDQLWSSLQEHLAGGLHEDDRTLAVLRIGRPRPDSDRSELSALESSL